MGTKPFCLFYIYVVPKAPLIIKKPPPKSRKSIKYIILHLLVKLENGLYNSIFENLKCRSTAHSISLAIVPFWFPTRGTYVVSFLMLTFFLLQIAYNGAVI
jgi:hypothetical protein